MAGSNFKNLLTTLDIPLLASIIFLQALGIAILYSFSFGGESNLWIQQAIYGLLGLVTMAVLTFVDYRSFKSTGWIIYIVALLTLVSVFIFGSASFGARRWIDFGIIRFQPSELYKVIEILTLAKVLSDFKYKVSSKFILWLFVIVIPALLIIRQPDLGTTIVTVCIGLIMLLSSKISKVQILGLIGIAIITIPLVWFNLADYQHRRIKTFLDPLLDPSGAGYNITQSRIAVGSGGLFGRGLGQGSQSQLNFLPVAHTDFIFAAIAEATGFIGSILVIGLFAFIVWRCLAISTATQDDYGRFVALGAGGMILLQFTIHIAGNLGLAPVTGIPLPFVSFGGTATISYLSIIGILQSIHIRNKGINY